MQPVVFGLDQLARRDVAQKRRSAAVERAAFRGEGIAASGQPADAERTGAVRIARGEQPIRRQQDEGKRAV